MFYDVTLRLFYHGNDVFTKLKLFTDIVNKDYNSDRARALKLIPLFSPLQIHALTVNLMFFDAYHVTFFHF